MTHNGKFGHKSGLDWVKMANFCHFAGFSIFSPKARLRLTRNGQFHPIHNFSHLLPPKGFIFWRNLKNFCFWGGRGDIGKFFEFFNFDSEWPISCDSQLFPSFATKACHFWRNFKNFCFRGGGTSANFLSFSTVLNRSTPKGLKMTHNGKFGQKSGLGRVKTANFGHFVGFYITNYSRN